MKNVQTDIVRERLSRNYKMFIRISFSLSLLFNGDLRGTTNNDRCVLTSGGRLHTTTRAFPSHDVYDGARRLRHRLTEPRVLRGESGTARLGQRSAEPEAHQGGTGADLPSLSFLTADERTSRFRSREPVGGSLAPAARRTTRPAPPAFPSV